VAVTGDVIDVGRRGHLEDRDDLVPLSGGGTERDEIASRKLTCERTDHRSTRQKPTGVPVKVRIDLSQRPKVSL
jgi:hypothetical protein